jgi:DNA-binding HxlR family transcriptional regulator
MTRTGRAAARRSYADPCGVARALDAVGERWALLVVRELSLGPRRFGQLRAGMPEVSPNVLSQRLRELEESGVIRRHELDPPASTVVYELTERGHQLDPVLQALGRWGSRQPEIGGRPMSAVSFLRGLRVLVDPAAADLTFGLVINSDPFRLEISGGTLTLARGRAPDAVAVLEGDVPALQRVLLLGGDLDAEPALSVTGDREAARRVPASFRLPR